MDKVGSDHIPEIIELSGRRITKAEIEELRATCRPESDLANRWAPDHDNLGINTLAPVLSRRK